MGNSVNEPVGNNGGVDTGYIRRDVRLGKVRHEAQHDRLALARRQGPHRLPQVRIRRYRLDQSDRTRQEATFQALPAYRPGQHVQRHPVDPVGPRLEPLQPAPSAKGRTPPADRNDRQEAGREVRSPTMRRSRARRFGCERSPPPARSRSCRRRSSRCRRPWRWRR